MTSDRVLLDTHIVLWALHDPARLGDQRSLVEDPMVERILSAVVVWEVAIKVGLRRLDLGMPVPTWSRRVTADLVTTGVAITDEHAAAVAALPPHHRDPFDRLLVAQAGLLGVPLLTADHVLAAYDIDVLLVG